MAAIGLHIRYRPIRFGLCVEENDFQSLTTAIKLASCLWGGLINPIIPIGSSNHQDITSLINQFRVDALIACSSDPDLLATIQENTNLNWIQSRSAHLVALFLPQLLFLDIRQPVEEVAESTTLSTVLLSDSDPLFTSSSMQFGLYPEGMELRYDFQSLVDEKMIVNQLQIKSDDEVPSDFLSLFTPLKLSAHRLNCSPGAMFVKKGLFYGSCLSFADLVWFWNLRACGHELLFYDAAFGNRLETARTAVLNKCTELNNPPRSFYSTTSLSDTDGSSLPAVGELFPASLESVKVLEDTERIPSFFFFSEHTALAQVSGQDIISVPLTNKPYKSKKAQQLMASMFPWQPKMSDSRKTLRPYYLTALNDFYSNYLASDPYFHRRTARVEPQGLAIFVDSEDDFLEIRPFDRVGALKQIFHMFGGFRLEPSDAGLVANRIIDQMGSLDSCRIFKIPGVRRLIREFQPNQSFNRSGAIKNLRTDPTSGDIDFNEYSALDLGFTQERVTPDLVFEYLVECDFFRPGLDFTCTLCHLEFWLSLDAIALKPRCAYCDTTFNAASQLRSRNWAFRTSGLLKTDNNQKGSIPIILVLEQLSRLLPNENFSYTTSMNILAEDNSTPPCESDLVIVSQSVKGKVTVIVSECKTRGPLEESDCENLLHVASKFDTSLFDLYVLFAKLDEFSTEELRMINTYKSSNTHARIILLSLEELHSLHIFQQSPTIQDFSIDSTMSFDRLANYSDAKFFSWTT